MTITASMAIAPPIAERIHPLEFFDMDASKPQKLTGLVDKLTKLGDAQLDSITTLVDGILKRD